MSIFQKWIEVFGLPNRPPPPTAWEVYPISEMGEVFLQKRWLVPENEETLIELLRKRKITIMPRFLHVVFPAAATLNDALKLFWDPRVTEQWPKEIMDHYGEQNRMHYMTDGKCEVLREVLCSAILRPDVTKHTLNNLLYYRTFDTSDGSWSDIYDVALTTGKRNVIEWALQQEFVPTSDQLQRFLLTMRPRPVTT